MPRRSDHGIADSTLLPELGQNTPVLRAAPEPQGGWWPFVWFSHTTACESHWTKEARRLAIELATAVKLDVIIATMSPFSTCEAAAAVSRSLRIPWVADLRDPWALDEFQVYPTALHRTAERWQMRRRLRTASLIVMNTPEAASRFLSSFQEFRRKTVVSITNGFDAEDFGPPAPEQPLQPFTIMHAGHLHTDAGLHQRKHTFQYRLLGRTERGMRILPRSHYYLVKACEKWLEAEPEAIPYFNLKLIGHITEKDRDLVVNSPISANITLGGYLNHVDTISAIRRASLLFLPLHTVENGQRATIVPGKTYEYMASGRPILAALPAGDALDYVRQTGTASTCAPEDVSAMSKIISEHFARWRRNMPTPTLNQVFIDRFERKEIAACFAQHLKSLCAEHNKPSHR